MIIIFNTEETKEIMALALPNTEDSDDGLDYAMRLLYDAEQATVVEYVIGRLKNSALWKTSIASIQHPTHAKAMYQDDDDCLVISIGETINWSKHEQHR